MKGQSIKYIVFILLLFFLFSLAAIAFSNVDVLAANLVWIVLIALFLVIVWKGDLILMLEEYQRAVIMRFGKVKRVGGPGWCIIIPFIEKPTIVDLRTQTIDVPKQDVVTKDSIELKLDAIIYLKVKKDHQSVVNSIIEVENYVEASRLYVVASLRDVVGSMELSEVISNIESINAKVKLNLENISKHWGIGVESVEIKDVQIPETVLEAMHEEKAAVQQKLARMERALAHKAEIEAVKEAASGLDEKALTYYYIKAIEQMSKGKGSQVFFPAEFAKLAGAFAGSGNSVAKPNSQELDEAKDLMKKYVDNAVKKTKKKSVKKKKK